MSLHSDIHGSHELQKRLITEESLRSSSSQPIYLSAVEIVGGEGYSSDFFRKLIYPLTDSSDYTLRELVKRVESVQDRFVKTDAFRDVNSSIHTDFKTIPPEDVKNYNKDKSIPTKVLFDVDSFNLNGGTGFLNVNNEDALAVNFNYLNNNFYGNAELVNIGVDYSPYAPNQHLLANAKFLANLNDPSFKFLVDVFNTHQNNKSWQKAAERSLGGLIGLQYANKVKNLHALTGVSLVKRSLYDIEEDAPESLRAFANESLKSSIVTQLAYSNTAYLNSITKNFPTDGYTFALSNEISANQGQTDSKQDKWFSKTTLALNLYKSFWNKNFTLHLSNNIGGVYDPSKSGIHVSDKFYLGGYNSFKGFSKSAVNTSGGLQFYKVALNFYAKLPSAIYTSHLKPATNTPMFEDGQGYEANPLRLYASLASGNVSDDLLSDNTHAGCFAVGIKYINDWANFDIGYNFAKRFGSDSQHGIKDGFQLSVSIGGSSRYT
ncbi:Piso0_005475 [Millerozyma farinosa CBS 7064]|uniref:Piso0_005475 protein n=1 Tax=Pichia sorbitophila (strain ATCC MYA-4447 / BCRC 22081 / CBS 7064 / NBRC 10061 / NRRL Y-12695) TaxID=559304 RepID=G8XZ42_PICSO|nr:Piso0_005475 [Millerozyma farinosa CBS 7064]